MSAAALERAALSNNPRNNLVLDIARINKYRLVKYIAPDLAAFKPFAVEDLVEIDDKSVKVAPCDRALVRTVSVQFDKHPREAMATAKHSKMV